MRRLAMNRFTTEESGTLLAALWEWQWRGSDPLAQELHDRLAECAEIFVAEFEDTDSSSN